MTLYSWRMTDPRNAAKELQDALDKVVTIDSDAVQPFDLSFFSEEPGASDQPMVMLNVSPSTALELAAWIRSKTEPSQVSHYQGVFDFTTE